MLEKKPLNSASSRQVKPPLGTACLGATAARDELRTEATASAEAGLTSVWRMAAGSRHKCSFEIE